MLVALHTLRQMPSTAGARKRSPLEKERDLARIQELHLKGLDSGEIAERLDMNRRWVIYDLQELQRRYAKATEDKLERHLNRQLAKIDLLEREAWAAWERSRSDREVTTKKQRRKDDSMMNEASQRVEQRNGDARYIAVIQWCIAERNRILGLYAPEEARISGRIEAVREIVYELPPTQNVPQLKLLPEPEPVAPGAARPPVVIDVTPTELWGDDDPQ